MTTFSKKSIYVFLTIFYVFTFAFPAAAGLVPCGGPGQDPCTLCHLFVLINNIFQFLVTLSIPLATLFIAWGGFMYITGGSVWASERGADKTRAGKNIIIAAVTGVAIVLLSWLIVGTLINFIGGYIAGGSPSQPPGFLWPWNEIACSA